MNLEFRGDSAVDCPSSGVEGSDDVVAKYWISRWAAAGLKIA